MNVRWRWGRSGGAMLMVVALGLFVSSAAAQESATKYKGRLLADVLRDLQGRGLPIVFSSAVVTADLRVEMEPRASVPRRQLDDLLAAHGLRAENGPGGIIQVVRADPPRKARPLRPDPTPETRDERTATKPTAQPTHTEHVTVSPRPPFRHDRGVGTEMRVDRSDLERAHGGLVDDPLRALQALPRASTADDYRGELAVRGSPFRHVEVVIDGVSTPWLQHTVHKRGAAGSIGMVTSHALEEMTLKAGAYPRRFGERLGSQLQMTLREGARDRLRVRGALGGFNATLVAEGPVGGSQRGSWLVAGRQSYLEWPSAQSGSTRTAFGFSDGAAKLVYDVGPSQQLGVSALMGMSSVDGEDEPSPNLPGEGTNRVSMLNLSWQSTLKPSLVLTQRAYVVARDVLNKDAADQARDRGTDEEIAYRADVTAHVGSGLLEAGAQIGRVATRQATASSTSIYTASSALQSGYVHFAWTATPGLTFSPGLRLSHTALLRHTTLTPWILGEWALRRRWTISASAGVAHQAPQLHQMFGPAGSRDLRPERAASVDTGVEHRVTDAVDWQVTVFSRRETDVLREPDLYPRLVDGTMVEPDADRYVNALRGWSRGIELVLNLRSARGLSGSAAYSYGKTRHTDTDRAETFWADFDQRHALGLAGVYRFSDRTSVGGLFRASSSFPIPAYLSEFDGRLFVADRRNRVRLPPYARLDLRAERRFARGDRRLTLFAEVVNVTNRANLGVGNGSVNRSTGEAVGFTDRLLRRRASGGILVEF